MSLKLKTLPIIATFFFSSYALASESWHYQCKNDFSETNLYINDLSFEWKTKFHGADILLGHTSKVLAIDKADDFIVVIYEAEQVGNPNSKLSFDLAKGKGISYSASVENYRTKSGVLVNNVVKNTVLTEYLNCSEQ